jgi:hypothetical protein
VQWIVNIGNLLGESPVTRTRSGSLGQWVPKAILPRHGVENMHSFATLKMNNRQFYSILSADNSTPNNELWSLTNRYSFHINRNTLVNHRKCRHILFASRCLKPSFEKHASFSWAVLRNRGKIKLSFKWSSLFWSHNSAENNLKLHFPKFAKNERKRRDYLC